MLGDALSSIANLCLHISTEVQFNLFIKTCGKVSKDLFHGPYNVSMRNAVADAVFFLKLTILCRDTVAFIVAKCLRTHVVNSGR